MKTWHLPAVALAVAGFALSSAAQSLAKPEPPPAPVVPITPPSPVLTAPPPRPAQNPADLPDSIIAWDSHDKSVTVDAGIPDASLSFSLTNVSQEPVIVTDVHTSCGCTTAQLPDMPWTLAPGTNGVIDISMSLAGKTGTVIKSVTVTTDKGTKNLIVRSVILPLQTSTSLAPGSRERNQMLAQVDRQMVFKGDCASCHVASDKGMLGAELFTSVCGVCHEAEHRSTMVPDLHVAKQERNADYWRNWITNGKQGSLMPAFAINAGGILTDQQIASLVDYLLKNMPTKPAPATVPSSTAR
jgi:mono/diheme cytochrome c family protein